VPDQHAKLSPSAAYRWFECSGSVAAQAGMPDDSNVYAREGTAAHSLGELSLTTGLSPDKYIGRVFDVPYRDKDGTEQVQSFTVDHDMAANVKVYTDYCRSVGSVMGAVTLVEQRVGLASVDPILAGVWGTSDFVVYDPKTKTLHVIDLKYGAGKAVDAEGNLQLRIYGLASWATFNDRFNVEHVVVTIVQPRVGEQAIKSASYTAVDMLDFMQEAIEAAERVRDEPQKRTAGSWCDWCKAKATCPTFAEGAMEVAKDEFAMVPAAQLTMDQILTLIDKATLLDDWIKGVRAYLHAEAMAGRTVPGHKLVPKRASRVYAAKEEEVIEKLGPKVADKKMLYEQPSLLSPAQMEKVVGKKAFAEANLTASVSSGYNLVRDTDARPGVSFNPADDFI